MIHIHFGFSVVGLVVFLLPMLINVLFFMKEKEDDKEQKQQKANPILEMTENITRVLYAIAICILICTEKLCFTSPFFYLGALCLILYYIVWIRYFAGGMKLELLRKKFLMVPIPLAIFPVLYYIFAGLWMCNYIAVGVMLVFGVAHFINSSKQLSE